MFYGIMFNSTIIIYHMCILDSQLNTVISCPLLHRQQLYLRNVQSRTLIYTITFLYISVS